MRRRVYVAYAVGQEPMRVFATLEDALRWVERKYHDRDVAEGDITWTHGMCEGGLDDRWVLGTMAVEGMNIDTDEES